MATYTTNYNLKKPALADKIRIADFNGNSDTIDGAMHDNAVLGAQLKSDIGIVENTNTATHNISAGQYVIWKGDLYTASDAISSGATLSNANLTAVSGGGLNALNSKITNGLDYYTLLNGEVVTATLTNKSLFNNRKISDYKTILAIVKRGGVYRCSFYIPTGLFDNTGAVISLSEVDSVNTQRWYEIKYVSDTTVSIQSSSNGENADMYLYGLNKI